EVVRLAGKAERVKAPQHEGAVADPRVAVVPVALAADGLRQRCGRRRKKRAGRAVREALERQRAALEVALPRVFGEVAPVDPLAPEIRGALDALERFLDCGRRRVLVPVLLARRVARARPHHGHVGLLTLAEDLGRVGSRPFETDPQVGDQLDRHLVGASARDGLVVALPGVLPPGGLLAVVEDRLAVDADLDVADHAARGAEEDVLGLVVGWRTAVGTLPPLAVIPGPDAHRVAHDQPAVSGAPGGLEDKRAWEVAAPSGNLDAGWPKAEATRRPVEHGREYARAVRPREAHPFHPPAWRDQTIDLAVGEEGIPGNGRERAGDPWFGDLRADLGDSRLAVTVLRRCDRLTQVSLAGFSGHFRPYREDMTMARRMRSKTCSGVPVPLIRSSATPCRA